MRMLIRLGLGRNVFVRLEDGQLGFDTLLLGNQSVFSLESD